MAFCQNRQHAIQRIVTSLIECSDAISRNDILLFLKQYPKKDSILCNIRRAHLVILYSDFANLDRSFKRFKACSVHH